MDWTSFLSQTHPQLFVSSSITVNCVAGYCDTRKLSGWWWVEAGACIRLPHDKSGWLLCAGQCQCQVLCQPGDMGPHTLGPLGVLAGEPLTQQYNHLQPLYWAGCRNDFVTLWRWCDVTWWCEDDNGDDLSRYNAIMSQGHLMPKSPPGHLNTATHTNSTDTAQCWYIHYPSTPWSPRTQVLHQCR